MRIAGRGATLFTTDAEALAWLERHFSAGPSPPSLQEEDWRMFRGDAARNALAGGGRPLLSRRWSQDTFEHPATGRAVQQLRQNYLDQHVPAIPALHPLAVNDVVLMRSARFLWAVDFATGKRIWSYPALDALASDGDELLGMAPAAPAGNALRAIEQRFWEDYTYGTLSSDGQRVFLVEDFDRATGGPQIIDARGTRRVPAGMRPLEAIRAGYDELTHVNFAMMQGMPEDVVRDSNGPMRLFGPGRHGAAADFKSKAFAEFLAGQTAAGLAGRLDVATMERLGIYAADDDSAEDVDHYFPQLQAYVGDAARHGRGLVIWMM